MPKYEFNNEADLINAAIAIFESNHSYQESRVAMCEPDEVGKYLLLKHQQEQHETFSAIFLNSKNQTITFETLFNGSINSAQVYPRTVAQKALKHNAAAVIFCHHHPSGDPEPSKSDIQLTLRLKEVLSMIDVRVLDHFVLGGTKAVSMARKMLI
jgi:DNA repair protein RadC